MKINFRNLTGLLFLITAASFPQSAIAQPKSSNDNVTIPEAFDRAYFENDPDFFRNRSLKRQLNTIFGFGSLFQNSYPENEVSRDGKLIHELYQNTLTQQVSSDPLIRTPDLPNPYNTSILSSPSLNVNSSNKIKELLFEKKTSR